MKGRKMAKAKETSPKKKVAKAPQKKAAAAAKKPAPLKKAAAAPKKSPPAGKKKPSAAKAAAKAYSIAEFAAMTYLTETGVTQWLKQGRLVGRQNDQGEWLIESANLDVPDVKRLVRG